MKFLNLNTLHNVINLMIISLGAALLASGCVTDTVTGAIDCSKSWISPHLTTIAITFLGAAKVVMNIVRDGFFGLIKQQPPVVK